MNDVPIIGQLHTSDDLVKSAAWSFEAGYKAAIDTIENLEWPPADDEDEYTLDVVVSRLRHCAKSVGPLAEMAAKKQVHKYLIKKARERVDPKNA